MKKLAGYPHVASPHNVKPFGVIHNDGYHIEKLTYESEPGIIVPSLLLVPESGEDRMPGVLYVNSKRQGRFCGGDRGIGQKRRGSCHRRAGWGKSQRQRSQSGEGQSWTLSSRIMTPP